MAAIDEQRSRPDIDREFVLTGKVMVEPAQQEFLDARFSIPLGSERVGGRLCVYRIGGHNRRFSVQTRAIMSRTGRRHKTFSARFSRLRRAGQFGWGGRGR